MNPTVKDLIELLKTFPQDAKIRVLAEKQGPWEVYTVYKEIEGLKDWQGVDYQKHLNVVDFGLS